MSNVFREFLDLLPKRPLYVGTVASLQPGGAVVQVVGGGIIHARGAATVGQRVFVRDGVIEGTAPALTYSEGQV